jgi:hypothetical protein
MIVVFAASLLGPVLVGLGVDTWTAAAASLGSFVVAVTLGNIVLRRAGFDVHIARDVAGWVRRRWPVIAVVGVLLAGCYAPPIRDTLWRRTIGAASGAALLGLSLALRRDWLGLRSSGATEVEPDDFELAHLGMFIGAVCALTWATGLVFRA